jgi:hypothetical protein
VLKYVMQWSFVTMVTAGVLTQGVVWSPFFILLITIVNKTGID